MRFGIGVGVGTQAWASELLNVHICTSMYIYIYIHMCVATFIPEYSFMYMPFIFTERHDYAYTFTSWFVPQWVG